MTIIGEPAHRRSPKGTSQMRALTKHLLASVVVGRISVCVCGGGGGGGVCMCAHADA